MIQVNVEILQSGNSVKNIYKRISKKISGQRGASKKGDIPNSIGRVYMAYDVGRAVFGELDMVGGESSIIAVIVKLAN